MNIKFVKDFIDEIIQQEGIKREELLDGGAVYYMNGNDGTNFDFECNVRSCEFYVFWQNEDGAIKVFIEEYGLDAYCYYDKNDPYNSYKIHRYEKRIKLDLAKICRYLAKTFDGNQIWDEAVINWD